MRAKSKNLRMVTVRIKRVVEVEEWATVTLPYAEYMETTDADLAEGATFEVADVERSVRYLGSEIISKSDSDESDDGNECLFNKEEV